MQTWKTCQHANGGVCPVLIATDRHCHATKAQLCQIFAPRHHRCHKLSITCQNTAFICIHTVIQDSSNPVFNDIGAEFFPWPIYRCHIISNPILSYLAHIHIIRHIMIYNDLYIYMMWVDVIWYDMIYYDYDYDMIWLWLWYDVIWYVFRYIQYVFLYPFLSHSSETKHFAALCLPGSDTKHRFHTAAGAQTDQTSDFRRLGPLDAGDTVDSNTTHHLSSPCQILNVWLCMIYIETYNII